MATIVTRAGKGSPLTHDEVDENFENINADKVEGGDSPTFGTVTATSFSDGTDTVDTGYVVNGSAKAYGKVDQTTSGHPVDSPSLNISSTTDDGTSRTSVSFTSSMSGTGYSISGGTDFSVQSFSSFQSRDAAAGSFTVYNSPDSSSSYVDGRVSFSVLGDLA